MPTVQWPPGFTPNRERVTERCYTCRADAQESERDYRFHGDIGIFRARRRLNPDGHLGGYVATTARVDDASWIDYTATVGPYAIVVRSYLAETVQVRANADIQRSYLRRGVDVDEYGHVENSDLSERYRVPSFETVINRSVSSPEHRTCSRCGNRYPLTRQYFSWSSARNRFNTWCVTCMREYARQRRATNRIAQQTRGESNARPFGVEIEFHGDRGSLAYEMRLRGLSCETQEYNHTTSHTTWKVITDASVSRGGELVSPILTGEAGFAALRLASDALRAAGCTVSRDTGFHVHHEVRDLTVAQFKRVFELWHMAQEGIDLLVSPSRRHNSYCSHLDGYDMRAIRGLTTMSQYQAGSQLSGDRFKNLNAQSFSRYGTLEVRQHQGTTSADKMCSWVSFGQAMIAHARDAETLAELPVRPYEAICQLLGNLPLEDATRAFLAERAAYFNGPNAPREGDPEELVSTTADIFDSGDNEEYYDEDNDYDRDPW